MTNSGWGIADKKGAAVVIGAIGLVIVAAAVAIAMASSWGGIAGTPSIEASASEPAPSAPLSPYPTPTPSQAPPATPEPTLQPTATPFPSGPATVAWALGEEQEGRVSAVIRRGDRWIAGGAVQGSSGLQAAVWMSVDAQDWSGPTLLPPEPATDDNGFRARHWINGLGEWDGALLAHGWNGVGCCDAGYPMLWRSDDGVTWSVADTAYGEAYHFPQRSVVTPQGQLAVLSATALGSGASVFVAGDLATWDEHPLTDPSRSVTLSGIAASPSLLMVVGTERHPYEAGEDPPTTAHALSSADGRTWTSLTTPNPHGTLDDVTWDPSRERFVAVGTDDDGAPAAWLSADGSGWSWIPLAEDVGRMHDVAAVAGLIVASGSVGPLFQATGETIAWTSHDGVTWRVMPLVDRQWHAVVGATPGSAVMVINQWDEADADSWQSWAGPVDE